MRTILIFTLLLQTINSHGQVYGQESETKYITICSRVLDGNFKKEVKIDLKSGEVFARSNTTKKYKPVALTPNDSSIKFIKDSLTFDFLKTLIKECAFDKVGFKISFITKNCYGLYPCFEEIKCIEFGRPHDQTNLQLIKLIDIYYRLRTKAKI